MPETSRHRRPVSRYCGRSASPARCNASLRAAALSMPTRPAQMADRVSAARAGHELTHPTPCGRSRLPKAAVDFTTKRTPISRPESRAKQSVANDCVNCDSTAPATIIPADSNRARFLTLLVANRIAPDTRRDQACRDALRSPWRLVPPQRNVGAKPCPRGCLHSLGCRRDERRQSFDGSRLGRSSNLHSVQMAQGRRPIISAGCAPVRFPGSPPLAKPLRETSGDCATTKRAATAISAGRRKR